MILPIVAYGDPVLKKKGKDIDANYPGLEELISNMWDTMHNANGIGLAAPQIGRSIRLFVVDATPFAEPDENGEGGMPELVDFKKVFINAEILEETGDEWAYNEGCLSIPDIHEDVYRHPTITVKYLDENFEEHTETFDGIAARIIQHEYDHIDGILFTDKLSSLRRRLLKGRLTSISKGKIKVGYRMRFPG
ncbi:MAG: peptide deformylase [Schleiferiaceae bacterium]